MSAIKTNQVLNLDGDRIGSVVVDSIANMKNLNTEIGANATVEVLGYYSKGDGGGGTFYWDSTSVEDDNGGTIIEATGVADGRWIRNCSGSVNVKWFGAVGDYSDATQTGTNDSPSVEAAILFIENTEKNTLFFPDGYYYLETMVDISIESVYHRSYRFVGTSQSGMNAGIPGGTRITGGLGIESLFRFICPLETSVGGYAAAFENIDFFGRNKEIGSAILNNVGGAPSRPFSVSSCNFRGFDKAFYSDISSTGLTTGLSTVSISKCNFVHNNYAVVANGQSGLMNLAFTENVCEQNSLGGIYGMDYSNGSIGGTCLISDNLMEGQPNAIVIVGGLLHTEVARNYFEVNSESIVNITNKNSSSSMYVHNNFYLNSTGYNSLQGGTVRYEDTWKDIVFGNTTGATSTVIPSILIKDGTTHHSAGFSPAASIFSTDIIDTNITKMGYIEKYLDVTSTPLGKMGYRTITSYTSLAPIDTAVADGDYIVAMALVRQKEGENAQVYLNVYDSANNRIGNTEPTAELGYQNSGDWVLVYRMCKVNSSSASIKIRWHSNAGDSIDISNTYVYKVSNPSSDVVLPIFLPSLDEIVDTSKCIFTSGTAGTAIYDTGITSLGVDGFANGGFYDVFAMGMVQPTGNAKRTVQYGQISIGYGGNGNEIDYITAWSPSVTAVTSPVVTAVFWDGITESSTASGLTDGYGIRVKIAGLQSGYEQYSELRIQKKY